MKTTERIGVRWAGTAAGIACLASIGWAQSFNLDFGDAAGTPAKSYAAAAGQAGEWMALPTDSPSLVVPLLDVQGRATRVTLIYSTAEDLGYDDPATTGDDAALLDDALRFDGTSMVTIGGLAPGLYDIYTYSWACDDPTRGAMRVSVAASPDPSSDVRGTEWRGAFVPGEHFARHQVPIREGDPVTLELEPLANSSGTLNGIQIVRQPLSIESADGSARSEEDSSAVEAPPLRAVPARKRH